MIDLNDLEVGDSIAIKGDSIYEVNSVKKYQEFFHINFGDDFLDEYRTDGNCGTEHIGKRAGDIVKVIKKESPKRWTDEDMINAFNAASWNDISSEPLTTEEWLEQYKVNK